MKRQLWKSGNIAVVTLTASAILGTLALLNVYLSSSSAYSLSVKSAKKTITVGDSITIHIEASATTPTNVFSGVVHFDPSLFTIKEIHYNTSIADLWTEEPWYSNGDGTVTFAGGTTRSGGFSGTGDLITIVFTSLAIGTQNIYIDEARILLHDGLGTDAVVEAPSTIFNITRATPPVGKTAETSIAIIPKKEKLDLNNDGKITIADLSVFFSFYYKNDLQADFNNDQKVSLADASILMTALRSD